MTNKEAFLKRTTHIKPKHLPLEKQVVDTDSNSMSYFSIYQNKIKIK